MGDRTPPNDVLGFLSGVGVFADLDAAALEAIAASAELRTFAAEETILVEDGQPADAFFVIVTGSVELVHEEEVIEILEPGEAFGHPSLITGMAPAFTVRAHEPTSAYAACHDAALAALGRPAGVGFVARTMRDRMTRTGHVVHGLPELGTVRVPN